MKTPCLLFALCLPVTAFAAPSDFNAIVDYGTQLVNDAGEVTIDAVTLASETVELDGRVRLEFNATLRNNDISYFSRVHLLFEPSGVEWTDVEVVRDFFVLFADLVPGGTSASPQTLVLLAPPAVSVTVKAQILAKQKLRISAFELHQFRLPAVAIDAGAEDNFEGVVLLGGVTPVMVFTVTSPALDAVGPGMLLLENPEGHTVDRGSGPYFLPPLADMISSHEAYADWQEGKVRTTRMVEVLGKTVHPMTGKVQFTFIQHGGQPGVPLNPFGPFNGGPVFRGFLDNLRTGTLSCTPATAFDPISDPDLQARDPYAPPVGNSAFTDFEDIERIIQFNNELDAHGPRYGTMRDLNGFFALHVPVNDLQLAPGIMLDGQFTLGGVHVGMSLRRRNNANITIIRVSTNVDVNMRLTAQAGADNSGGPLLERERTLGTLPLPPVVFTIGGVPITIQPAFTLRAGATLDAPTTIVIPLQTSCVAGARMEWDESKPSGQQYSYTPFSAPRPLGLSKPGLAQALAFTATMFAETRLDVVIEGLAGPYVGARVTGQFGLTPLADPWWNFDADLDITAGFQMSALGFDLIDAGTTMQGPVLFHRDAGGAVGSGGTGPLDPAEGANVRWGRGVFWDGGAIPYDALLARVAGTAEDVFTVLPAPNSLYSPLVRIGANGTIIWSKSFINVLPSALGAMPDGGLALAGGYNGAHFLTRIDGAGNVLWSRDFDLVNNTGGAQNVYIKSIVTREPTPGNFDIFVCGYRDEALNTLDTDPFLLKYDGAGNLIFAKRFASVDAEVVEQAILLQNGDILFIGTNKLSPDGIGLPGPGAADGAWLMKAGPDGTFHDGLRTNAGLGMQWHSACEAPDGTIFCGGLQFHTVLVEYPALAIGRFNANFDIEQLVTVGEAMLTDKATLFNNTSGDDAQDFHDWLPLSGLTLFDLATKVEWTPSGVIAGGITALGYDRAPLIMCFTDNLNLRWFTTHEGAFGDTLHDFVATDGGLLTAGFTNSMTSFGSTAPGAVFLKVPFEGRLDLHPGVRGLTKFLQPSVYNLKGTFDNVGIPSPFQGYSGTQELNLTSTTQAMVAGSPLPPLNAYTFTNWTPLEKGVPGAPMTYAQWTAYHQLPPGSSAPTADADADGRSNGAEYFFGGDPYSNQDAKPSFIITRTPGGNLTFTTTRSRFAQLLPPLLETSINLSNWDPLSFGTLTTTPLDGITDQISFTLPMTNEAKRFYRAAAP